MPANQNRAGSTTGQSKAVLEALAQIGDTSLAEALTGLTDGNKRLAFVLGQLISELSTTIEKLNADLNARVETLHMKHTEAELVIAKLPTALIAPDAKECFATMKQRIDIMWRTFVGLVVAGATSLAGVALYLIEHAK